MRSREPAPDRRHGGDALFSRDRPVLFAYHGYPALIHRLTYRRANHAGLHVRGFREEGTTTTPFDMVMLNDLDRFHLVMDVIDRVPGLAQRAAAPASIQERRAATPPCLHPPGRRRRPRRPGLGVARVGATGQGGHPRPARAARLAWSGTVSSIVRQGGSRCT